jgi:uncharacterized oligopeptide transporter (OPT) family protein
MTSSKTGGTRISARAVVSGFVMALVLCTMNSYLTLKFGVIEEGPTIAALFFFAVFFVSRMPITSAEMVIVATMGSAGGSFGFIANFYAAKAMVGEAYTVPQMIAFGVVSSLIGLVMVVPLRQLLILRDNLPWPGSKATAGVIKALVEEGDPRQPRILMVTLVVMITALVLNNDSGVGWLPAETALPFGLAAVGGAIAWSPFAIAGSYLMGLRTCFGFLVGAVVLMIMARHTPVPETPHRYYWPGLGFLLASGLTGMALNWRAFVGAFRSMASMGQKTDDDDPVMSGKTLGLVALVAFGAAAVLMPSMFGVSLIIVVVLIAVGGLIQNIIATRAQALTAFNPARVMGVMMQGVTSLFGGSTAAINLTGAGVVAGSGAQAGNLTGDMAYGRWLKVPSRWQFWLQAATVLPCAVAAALVFDALRRQFPMTLDTPLSASVAKMWAATAQIFEQGQSALPPGALTALAVGAVAGTVYYLIDHFLPTKIKPFFPETTGIGLGMVLWVSQGLSFFLGGVLMWIVLGRLLRIRDTSLTTFAVGCIVAEGLGGVLKALLAQFGVIGAG